MDTIGGCQISVEVAGPNLPQTYSLVPDTVHSLASHIINECVGRAGKVGGFATLDIGNLIDWVINPSSDLGRYRKPFGPNPANRRVHPPRG